MDSTSWNSLWVELDDQSRVTPKTHTAKAEVTPLHLVRINGQWQIRIEKPLEKRLFNVMDDLLLSSSEDEEEEKKEEKKETRTREQQVLPAGKKRTGVAPTDARIESIFTYNNLIKERMKTQMAESNTTRKGPRSSTKGKPRGKLMKSMQRTARKQFPNRVAPYPKPGTSS